MPLKNTKRSVKPIECLISLGSNVGNRAHHLRKAVSSIGKITGVKILKKSRIYETEPLGPSRKKFLNCALRIKTTRSAMGLLIEFKRLEALAGRKPGLRWGPRPLDIDLITYGNEKIKTPWLTVPHSEAVRRVFVLVPLSEVAPQAKLSSGRTIQQALSRLKDVSRSVKLY